MPPESRVSREKAAKVLGLSDTQLKNYVAAGEFGALAKGESLRESVLAQWDEERPRIELSPEEYKRSLQFAVAEFYLGGTKSDFGSSTRRTAGKFIDNYASGKLGELAFASFLRERYRVEAELDFGHHEGIPAQDIDSIRRVGKRSWNPPAMRVSIKTTKAGNGYLLVPEAEFTSDDRKSHAYVFVRVDLPGDHLIRGLYAAGGLAGVEDEIGDDAVLLEEAISVSGQIVGFAWRDDFPVDPVDAIGDLQLAGPNRALRSGKMRTSSADWAEFAKELLGKENA